MIERPKKRLKRFLSRRGYLPISDVHDILERATAKNQTP